MNIVNLRLLSQQLATPQFDRADDVVDWFGMVQAQEPQMMRWAVCMRMRHPSLASLREAYDAGRIVRTHLFRCTWQLVAATDLRWMLQLCADRNRRAIDGYLAQQGQHLSEADYEHCNQVLKQVLAGRNSVTKDQLLQLCADQGLVADAHTMSIYLRRAEADGIICSGTLHPRQSTYALVDERIAPTPDLTTEEAVTRLTQKYFRSHGPATLDDFVWWSALPRRTCLQAICALGAELTSKHYKGDTYYLHKDSRTRGCRNQTILLPSYDEYLIGYKSRHHVLAEEYRHHAHNNYGIFHPVVLSRGHVVGNWHPRHQQAEFFRPEFETDTTPAFKRYERFLKTENV